jgi:hypothetical protein
VCAVHGRGFEVKRHRVTATETLIDGLLLSSMVNVNEMFCWKIAYLNAVVEHYLSCRSKVRTPSIHRRGGGQLGPFSAKTANFDIIASGISGT